MNVNEQLKTQAEMVIREVIEGMSGRMCYEHENVDYLLWAVALAGTGDHLEIGVLHGGSLVASALLKKKLGLAGNFVGVDPMNGYYMASPVWKSANDPVSGQPVEPKTVFANAEKFGVLTGLDLICKPSYPWPEELKGRTFVSAFIDGDHWGDGPWIDWKNVSACTTRYVIFDNDDDGHPAVQHTCDEAGKTPGWKIVLRQGITCVLEKEVQ